MSATILVIDDDAGILDAVTMLLEDEGYQVQASTHPAKALELLHTDMPLPDLIILDVLLSGQDGRDLCRRLKTHDRTQAIPIVMMSAHPNVAASVAACGADGLLTKPFDIDALLAQVHTLIVAQS